MQWLGGWFLSSLDLVCAEAFQYGFLKIQHDFQVCWTTYNFSSSGSSYAGKGHMPPQNPCNPTGESICGSCQRDILKPLWVEPQHPPRSGTSWLWTNTAHAKPQGDIWVHQTTSGMPSARGPRSGLFLFGELLSLHKIVHSPRTCCWRKPEGWWPSFPFLFILAI